MEINQKSINKNIVEVLKQYFKLKGSPIAIY